MGKPLVLIVDDEHANQFLLEGLLFAHGYETLTASNGEECLELLKNHFPDLILLDIMMPKMTGIEVLDVIMSSEQFRHIPILMVSAKTATPDIGEALEKGAIDYIKKPFDEMELLARVKVGIRLKENEDHLREMVRQREEIVKIISHDLRSPFAAINGFAEILIGDENLTAEQKKHIGFIIDSVNFSQDYFNKLLSWTRLEHQEIVLNKTKYAIFQIVSLAIKFFEKKASQKSIQIKNEIDESHTAEVDKTYFSQVLANLLNNAIKFTNKNGVIRCFSEQFHDKLAIIISDNGIGMPDDISPEIFFKSNVSISRRGTNGEKGTGLGLGICKKILDAHGFNFTFRGNANGGTDFIIELDNRTARKSENL